MTSKLKSIVIVGSGIAAWSVANAISFHKRFKITIIGKPNTTYGAQQLSPNGISSYKQLVQNVEISQDIKKLYNLKFSTIKKDCPITLSNYNLNKNNNFYGSIARSSLLKKLKFSALKNQNIKFENDAVDFFSQEEYNEAKIITQLGKQYTADLIIGADGFNGKSRKYVCGNEAKKNKIIFRATSSDPQKIKLSKNILKVFFTTKGHFVIYPYKENNKDFVNYIFVPNQRYQNLFRENPINDNISVLENLKWNFTYSFDNNVDVSTTYKGNVLLFGDAAFPIQPHLAQGGNQILSDAVYLKNVTKNGISVESLISNYIQNRFKLKKELKKNSEIVGKIFGLNKIFSIPRNFIISNFSNEILDELFSLIWEDKYED